MRICRSSSCRAFATRGTCQRFSFEKPAKYEPNDDFVVKPASFMNSGLLRPSSAIRLAISYARAIRASGLDIAYLLRLLCLDRSGPSPPDSQHHIDTRLNTSASLQSVHTLQEQRVVVCHLVTEKILHCYADGLAQPCIPPLFLSNFEGKISNREIRAAGMILTNMPFYGIDRESAHTVLLIGEGAPL